MAARAQSTGKAQSSPDVETQDVYDLNVLEAPSARKDTCVHADPENPLCQLKLGFSQVSPLGSCGLHLPAGIFPWIWGTACEQLFG